MMDENLELLEYIYKNSEMGVFSCTKLIQELNKKENKIKKIIEGILKGYENYFKESKKLIKKDKYPESRNSIMTKFGNDIGIKMEVKKDNSDSAIAKLLTQGLTMGCVDIASKIDRYEKDVDKKILKLAKEYLKFQKESINLIKKYL